MKNKSLSFFGNIKKYAEIPALLILVFFAVIIAADRRYLSAVSDGAALWAATIFPALLPYSFIVFIVSSLKITGKLAQKVNPLSKRLWNINGNGFYALTVSLTSGYPLGSKTVADLKNGGFLGEAESVRAAALCSSSSPAFIIASVGSITFCNTFFGVCLFVCHVLSVFSVGFIFAFYKRKERPLNVFMAQNNSNINLLKDGVYSSVISVLTVGGMITLFYLLTEILSGIGVIGGISKAINVIVNNENISYAISTGFFECTRGIKILSESGIAFFTLPIAGAICGFGGISVIAQSVAYLKSAKIKTAPFILSRILAAAFNFIYGIIFSLLFF